MIYLVSSVAIVSSFMMIKKYENKQNFWRCLAFAIITYVCYLCAVAGIMTVIHISVDIYTISILNFLGVICISVYIYKKKEIQNYYINISDTLFIVVLICFTVCIFFSRFSKDLNIVFETSDPGVHLKSAMNFVNKKAVSGMYIGQLLNGLFIQSLEKFFAGEFVYKSFIIQYGFNFFMAGYIFWAVIKKYQTNRIMCLVGDIITIAYMLGYPYNDMLYGFVYLQIAVTIVCYIIGLMQDYVYEKINIWAWGGMIGIGCLGVSIGYTLFAPPVYVSVLCFVAYKAYRESWLKSRSNFLPNKKFITCCLNIFILPTFLTILIIVILPKIQGSSTEYGTVLMVEGAIYRNLFSDFLLFILPAAYGLISGIKRKKINMISFCLPIFSVYYLYFFGEMLREQVSTYYFYKLNYLMWMFICIAFVIGMEELVYREKILFTIIVSGMILLTASYLTNFETNLRQKNMNYTYYIEAPTFFRIYACNDVFKEYPKQMSEELVEISGIVNSMDEDEKVVFVGCWQDLFWYEALTNQRLGNLYNYSYAEVIERFKAEKYGKYAVVLKEAEGLEEYQQYIQERIIYENDYAYIIGK